MTVKLSDHRNCFDDDSASSLTCVHAAKVTNNLYFYCIPIHHAHTDFEQMSTQKKKLQKETIQFQEIYCAERHDLRVYVKSRAEPSVMQSSEFV